MKIFYVRSLKTFINLNHVVEVNHGRNHTDAWAKVHSINMPEPLELEGADAEQLVEYLVRQSSKPEA